MIATAFSRTPKLPPALPAFKLGALLINGIATEPDTEPRRYRVRLSVDGDHPMIADDRRGAQRRGYSKWARSITITRLCDGKQWIFGEHSAGFPGGFVDSDEHALARLAADERARARLFGGAQ
jgi:hypothetical protein